MTLADATILVLEDEPIISIQLEDMLDSAGANVVVTATVAAATEALESRSFDAAILDINIHGELSFPVALALKGRGVPFIFASGYGDAIHPPELKGVPTLGKPYGLDDIVRALAR